MTQLHFTALPDNYIQEDVTSLISFRKLVRIGLTSSDGPIVVHCRHFYNLVIHCILNGLIILRCTLWKKVIWYLKFLRMKSFNFSLMFFFFVLTCQRIIAFNVSKLWHNLFPIYTSNHFGYMYSIFTLLSTIISLQVVILIQTPSDLDPP